MTKAFKCLRCQKRTANVKVIRLVGGKAQSTFLCEECAAEVSPFHPPFVSFQEAIEKVLDHLVQKQSAQEQAVGGGAAEGPRCPVCGTTLALYRSSFRLGCSQCYRTFEETLEGQLRRYHGSTRHVGRTPSAIPARPSENDAAAADLRRDLARAVLEEDFERAIELRNRLRSLESRSDRDGVQAPEA